MRDQPVTSHCRDCLGGLLDCQGYQASGPALSVARDAALGAIIAGLICVYGNHLDRAKLDLSGIPEFWSQESQAFHNFASFGGLVGAITGRVSELPQAPSRCAARITVGQRLAARSDSPRSAFLTPGRSHVYPKQISGARGGRQGAGEWRPSSAPRAPPDRVRELGRQTGVLATLRGETSHGRRRVRKAAKRTWGYR